MAETDRVVPWAELTAAIGPVYPQGSPAGGRPPAPLERMLRIYFLQLWFNLSDPAVEEALYDYESMRRLDGIDLGQEAAPDETTVRKFRHLPERNGLGQTLLTAINRYLGENGIKVTTGTIVDPTTISAPSSTKNRDGERDPETPQTRKGNQWYVGMKAHVAVDSRTKLIHTVQASAANVADNDALPYLSHGRETPGGDQAYLGHATVIRRVARRARDFTNQRYRWGSRVDERMRAVNRTTSRVRPKVEHAIGVITRVFGFEKVCYRSLAKNRHRLEVTGALANLSMVRRQLLRGT